MPKMRLSITYVVGGGGRGRELSESLRPPTFTVKRNRVVSDTGSSSRSRSFCQSGNGGTHEPGGAGRELSLPWCVQ